MAISSYDLKTSTALSSSVIDMVNISLCFIAVTNSKYINRGTIRV
jgi:hypothetical protein